MRFSSRIWPRNRYLTGCALLVLGVLVFSLVAKIPFLHRLFQTTVPRGF